MVARARTLAAAGLVSAIAGCAVIAGLGTDYDVGGADASAQSGDGGAVDAGPPVEDCVNGKDDDGDGLVDCADPECGDYACIDAPAANFTAFRTGPRALSDGRPASCGDGGVYFVGPLADTATCDACTCGAPDGGSCTAAVDCWVQNDCSVTKLTNASIPVDGTCSSHDGINGGPNGCKVTGTSVDAGSCAPSGGAAHLGPAWTGAVEVCPAPAGGGGGGCAAGKVCVNKKATGGAASCLLPSVPGTTCPSGWSTSTAFYPAGAVKDARSCTPCTCGPPNASCSQPTVTAWASGNCTTGVSLTVGTSCTGGTGVVFPSPYSAKLTKVTLNPGSCAPSGGVPANSVQRGDAVTFCCAP